MPGAVFFALCSFFLVVGEAKDPQGTPVDPWSGVPRISGNSPVAMPGSPETWGLRGAKGLAVVATLDLPSGRPLAVASSRPGDTWVLIDQPLPGLPGVEPDGVSPQLIRFSRQGDGWKQTGQFAAPVGSRSTRPRWSGAWTCPRRNR